VRIAQVAPLAESVPPKLYGGTERVVSWLTEELIGLGHEVALFASGDSRTSGTLIPASPHALRLGRSKTDPAIPQAMLLETLAERAADFDVIHCHIDWIHLPLLSRLGVPFVTTTHNRLDLPGLADLMSLLTDAPFVSISDNQRSFLPQAQWLGTVYHGLPADCLRPSFGRGHYLAFLGRIAAEKGPEQAIQIAQGAAMPLRIAAKIPRAEQGYFQKAIQPRLKAGEIELVGEVNEGSKQDFLANAAALLFPIDWPEPFGLVMIEAMACGTPVIAYRAGSVPELVEDGVTGFIVENEAQAIETTGKIDQIDRRGVRKRFEERFTATRMAQDYLRCYEALSACARPRVNMAGDTIPMPRLPT
jgi:glycosyltransferase involved in cell wall biosynthesis